MFQCNQYIYRVLNKSVILLLLINFHEVVSSNSKTEKLFLGRCWEYQYVKNPEIFTDGLSNCTILFEKFTSAFQYKKPCSTDEGAFSDFISYGNRNLSFPNNKLIFWSGVHNWIAEFTEETDDYFSLEETFLGYIVNDMTFCSSQDSPGFTDDCKSKLNSGDCDTSKSAQEVFWIDISKDFSSKAEGNVAVILNVTVDPVFKEDSIFASVELPNLLKGSVAKLTVFSAHYVNETVTESCGKGSLKKMENHVISSNVTFECKENPMAIWHFLCLKTLNHKDCFVMNKSSTIQSHHTYLCMIALLYLNARFSEYGNFIL